MRLRRVTLLAVLSMLPGCGGGGAGPTPPAPSPQVGGDYDVAVQLVENACGNGVQVQPQPTSVTHAAGATTFTLVHGGLQVTGTLSRDGAFTTQPVAVQDPLGPAQLAISGRFTTNGLEATVTVDVQRAAPAPACRYIVAWSGTKRGAPNVIG
jgi:hypothetical protein